MRICGSRATSECRYTIMSKPNRIHWLLLIEMCVGIGVICWALMCPVDLILDWKETMGVRAYLPRACIPIAVASVALMGVTVLYMVSKGVLSQSALEKILTLMLVTFVGYGLLEFFTAEKRCGEVINPAAEAGTMTNDLASVNNASRVD